MYLHGVGAVAMEINMALTQSTLSAAYTKFKIGRIVRSYGLVFVYNDKLYYYIGSLPHTITGSTPYSDGGVSTITSTGNWKQVSTLEVGINGISKLSGIIPLDGEIFYIRDILGNTTGRQDSGGGLFTYKANIPKSSHNGFNIHSPTVPLNNLSDYLGGIGESDPSGYGCFVRDTVDGRIRLSHCGIYDGFVDVATSTKAVESLLKITGSSVLDVELSVLNVTLLNTAGTKHIYGEKRLVLADNGRIFKFHNDSPNGSILLHFVDLDGNGKSSVEDGGLLQSNNIKLLQMNRCKVHDFQKTGTPQANGIATTGIGCSTVLVDCELYNCGSQLLYPQTSYVSIRNPNMHDSPGHGVAFVTADEINWEGGRVTNCDYGLLVYSTTSYRSRMKRLHLTGVSLSGNNKAFEVARRYEDPSVSGGFSDVVFTDVNTTGCNIASTLGNTATDNSDGYSLRGAHLNNVIFDRYLELYSVRSVNITGGRIISLRTNGNVSQVMVYSCQLVGTGSSDPTNSILYLRSGTNLSDVYIDARGSTNYNSYLFGETGSTVSGPTDIDIPVVAPPTLSYKLNNNLYNKIGLSRGVMGRDMSKQVWGVGMKPFWEESLGKFVIWDGTNTTDMNGTVVP